jgi:hypothetical protein
MKALHEKPEMAHGLYNAGPMSDATHWALGKAQGDRRGWFLIRQRVHLTDGREVGTVVEAMRWPYTDASKGVKADDYALGVLWDDAKMLELARDANLTLTQDGEVYLHGDLQKSAQEPIGLATHALRRVNLADGRIGRPLL